jgi:hypothetical protein
MTIGCRNPDVAAPLSLHNPAVVFDEGALPLGAAVFTLAALRSPMQRKT